MQIHILVLISLQLSTAAVSFSVSTSSISGRPAVHVQEISQDLRDNYHKKMARLVSSLIDPDYLSSWAFPGLQAEFGENYHLIHNLDHYNSYTSTALLRLYPLFTLESAISETPDYATVPENLIYNVYDVLTDSKLEYRPRVFVYRTITDEVKALSYEEMAQKTTEILSKINQLQTLKPEEYGTHILGLIQTINSFAPVDRVSVQWYEHPDPEAEAATKFVPPQPGQKRVRRAPALDLGEPVLKTELNLPHLGPKFYHILNNITVDDE